MTMTSKAVTRGVLGVALIIQKNVSVILFNKNKMTSAVSKYTKNMFVAGSLPWTDPSGEAYKLSQTPSCIMAAARRKRSSRKGKGRTERRGKGMEGTRGSEWETAENISNKLPVTALKTANDPISTGLY